MTAQDKKDFEQFKLLKETGYNALAKIEADYERKSAQITLLDQLIESKQKELDRLTQAVQSYHKFI